MNDITMVLSLIFSYIENTSKTITNLKSKKDHIEFDHRGNTYKLVIVKIKTKGDV
jgi:hypothetical protein